MSFDYLPGTNIYLKQRKDMFRVNTDTHLLGKFMIIKENDKVLDIGTNNGALLLYASQYTKNLYGVDILEEAIALAKENLAYNDVCAHLENVAVQEYYPGLVFDRIITNPPYFNTGNDGNKNANRFLEVARHDKYLPLDDLFSAFNRLLSENGHIYMVHRPSYLGFIMLMCDKYGFKIVRLKMVYDENKNEAVSLLLELKRGKIDLIKVERDIIVR